MSKTLVNYIILFLILIPAQAVIFNHIVLFGVAIAMMFIFLIISLPLSLSTNLSMTVGFLAGLLVDIFADTAGENALAATMLAFARKPLFRLYMSNEDFGPLIPSARSMGREAYWKYLLTMSLIYCVLIFTIEAFQFFNFKLMILRIVCSTIFTFVIVYSLDSLINSQREKKL
jgi:rod shape-determining protein MreD